MTTNESEITKLAQAGALAILPGMRYAIDLIKTRVAEMEAQLQKLMGGEAAAPEPGRPRGAYKSRKKPTRSGWPADPAERSAEMLRRQAVRRAKKAAKAKSEAASRSAKARWNRMTKTERKARIDRLNAARVKPAALEAAS